MRKLIILHGWQSSKEKWERVKQELESEKVKVIIPDLPGFKSQAKLQKSWNLDDYLRWFKDFSSGQERFFLLGHSFGGRIAIKFALNYPQDLEGLILVSSGGIESRKNIKKLFLKTFIPSFKKFSFIPGYSFLRKLFYKYVVRKTDYLEARGHLRETFKKIISEDLTPCLPWVKLNTLIIWGEKDKILPLSDGKLMNQNIKNSDLVILKDVGHAPYLECPKKLANLIIDFIKK